MSYFLFSQNNSGGNFVFDPKGITHYVVIEAKTADEADARAEGLGIYFDGCNEGIDCPCCGDRWSRAYGEGDEEPKVYQHRLGVTKPRERWEFMPDGWMQPRPEAVLHSLNGEVQWFNADNTFAEAP